MKKLITSLSIIALSGIMSLDASALYTGDLNGDGKVDLADMVYLAKEINNDSTDKTLDMNASGKVDDNDLHRLADIIISGKLFEDTGMNVGIGGWDDSGEDFGGAVKAPAFSPRSGEETRFYMRNPKSEGNDRYSMEFGISEGNEAPAGILFSICLPRELFFDASKTVELDPAISSTHKLYGTPKFVKENENEEWSEYVLRFIVLSPDLASLSSPVLKLGKIFYGVSDCYDYPRFINCQITDSNGQCTDIPEHFGDYFGNFMPVDVTSVWFETTEMSLTKGEQRGLYAYIDPWDATDLTLVWTSSDESVAAVSTDDGRVAAITALREGVAFITATASNGISATCTVTVVAKEIEMESIILDTTELSLEVGDTHQFEVTVIPENTSHTELEWWVDDEAVATTDQNGLVTMTGEGSTTVHVRSAVWNNVDASCIINVTSDVKTVISDNGSCDIYTLEGILVKKEATASDIDNLERGIYLIHRNGKTIKLLK